MVNRKNSTIYEAGFDKYNQIQPRIKKYIMNKNSIFRTNYYGFAKTTKKTLKNQIDLLKNKLYNIQRT